jgi:hypothetical protein
MNGDGARRQAASIILSVAFLALVTNGTHSAATDSSFAFTASGDLGSASPSTDASFDKMLQLSASDGVAFGVALGDLSYRNDEAAWCSYVRSHIGPDLPLEIITGNHEATPDDGYIGNYASCMPDKLTSQPYNYGSPTGYAKQWYFDYPVGTPLMRMILISPNLTVDGYKYNFTVGSDPYNWLSAAIDDAHTQGIPWVVVGMHVVCESIGGKPCAAGLPLMNLLLSKNVDLILQAHNHEYQRSKQLALNGTTCTKLTMSPAPADLDCISDDGADGIYTKGRGSVIVIDGTFGDSLYDLTLTDSDRPYFASFMGRNVASNGGAYSFGLVEYRVTPTQLIGRFVKTAGDGSFGDAFAIDATGGGDAVVPAMPSGVTATAGDGQVTVTWTANGESDLLNYDIGYREVGSDSYTIVAGIPATVTANTITGLTNGTEYEFVVQARDASGNLSPASTPAQAQPVLSTDQPPSLVVTAPASGARVRGIVHVTGTAADDVGVAKVEVALDANTPQLATGTTNWTYQFNSARSRDGAHTLTVTATDSAGKTTTTSVPLTFDNTPPPVITGLALAPGDHAVTASWDASSAPDFSYYQLQQRLSGTTKWAKTTKVTAAPVAGRVSWAATGLSQGTSYDFRVLVCDLIKNCTTRGPIGSAVAGP